MHMAGIGAPELLIALVIVLLLFGGAKLPKLARSLGQAQKEFKQRSPEGPKTIPTRRPKTDPSRRPAVAVSPGTGRLEASCRS